MRYQRDLDRGSFALHANLFRYAMLRKLGGRWVELDIVMLGEELLPDEIFFPIARHFRCLNFMEFGDVKCWSAVFNAA